MIFGILAGFGRRITFRYFQVYNNTMEQDAFCNMGNASGIKSVINMCSSTCDVYIYVWVDLIHKRRLCLGCILDIECPRSSKALNKWG